MSKRKVESRNDQFVTKSATSIWNEIPSINNPYIAESSYCHGYDLMELLKKRSFIDVLYLIFRGELPTTDQEHLLEQLMIAQINPGPRHPATQASMNAAISRAHNEHILPVSLSILGGAYMGGKEVENSMRFLRDHIMRPPGDVANELDHNAPSSNEGDRHVAPGFGSYYGGIDLLQTKIAKKLMAINSDGKYFNWAQRFIDTVDSAVAPVGWLAPGVVATVLCELGFDPKSGAGLYQIISAPGLLAHGLEMADKPLTAMPFLDEDHYVIERE